MSSLIGCNFKTESKEYKAENHKLEKSINMKTNNYTISITATKLPLFPFVFLCENNKSL